MTSRALTLGTGGLTIRPAQVWGNVRLVPLVRDEPIQDLRLALRDYGGTAFVDLGRTTYTSYVPHGLVMRWADGVAEVPVDTRIGTREARRRGFAFELQRMVRRETRDQLRMLPLHTAMEGFLSLHFGGPDIARRCYSDRFLRHGRDPSIEMSIRGTAIDGLDEALRVFEVHEGQCGVMVFVADTLASVTLVSHPDDYLALHRALIGDFYGNLVYQHGWHQRELQTWRVELEGTDLPSIRDALARARASWAGFATQMASGLLGRTVRAERIRRTGRFQLVRFLTGHEDAMHDGEHLGEAMITSDGELAYLKSYRLDRGQVRRASMLKRLAAHDWDPQALADHEGHGLVPRIRRDLDDCGLGWILR